MRILLLALVCPFAMAASMDISLPTGELISVDDAGYGYSTEWNGAGGTMQVGVSIKGVALAEVLTAMPADSADHERPIMTLSPKEGKTIIVSDPAIIAAVGAKVDRLNAVALPAFLKEAYARGRPNPMPPVPGKERKPVPWPKGVRPFDIRKDHERFSLMHDPDEAVLVYQGTGTTPQKAEFTCTISFPMAAADHQAMRRLVPSGLVFVQQPPAGAPRLLPPMGARTDLIGIQDPVYELRFYKETVRNQMGPEDVDTCIAWKDQAPAKMTRLFDQAFVACIDMARRRLPDPKAAPKR